MARPATLDGTVFAAVYDWLGDNGVNEWLPEYPLIEVDASTIRYTAFTWTSEEARGYNSDMVVDDNRQDAAVCWRVVPLRVPPSPDLSLAAMLGGCALVASRTGRRRLERLTGFIRRLCHHPVRIATRPRAWLAPRPSGHGRRASVPPPRAAEDGPVPGR